jgi:PadR family transcriptional regulator PadR
VHSEALKGHLDSLVLAVVSEEPLHGYAIIQRLRLLSGGEFDLPEGTVYPALHRLERLGLLSSAWVTFRGRRRRVYELTRRGKEVLRERRGEWTSFSRAIEAVLA